MNLFVLFLFLIPTAVFTTGIVAIWFSFNDLPSACNISSLADVLACASFDTVYIFIVVVLMILLYIKLEAINIIINTNYECPNRYKPIARMILYLNGLSDVNFEFKLLLVAILDIVIFDVLLPLFGILFQGRFMFITHFCYAIALNLIFIVGIMVIPWFCCDECLIRHLKVSEAEDLL